MESGSAIYKRCRDAFQGKKYVGMTYIDIGMIDGSRMVVGGYLLFEKQAFRANDGRIMSNGPLGRW